ncbi:hypothetical protein CALVIDRAFT_603521 [Calocera viscosa TUFC12733]|uniref:Uncharacterized protein n=1 Tax=Calocera viscosa (strain TUFC12733) TaxID=1330018 RepID=A0A167FM98_CALVF|nr:hypothetical protein CALVIDRAFT_603521 [Calocera viscosa TUFC12733]
MPARAQPWALRALISLMSAICGSGLPLEYFGAVFAAMTAIPSIMIITGIKQLIAFNRGHVSDGENDWTFGQTLALLLLTLPLAQVLDRVWAEITSHWRGFSAEAPVDDGAGVSSAAPEAEKLEDPATAEERTTGSSKGVVGSATLI